MATAEAALAVPEALALAALDARARRDALDIGRSLLVQAPAGSGKTTVLTARFLVALAAVETPEAVLAITFTRKAAAEMRQRIIAALQSAGAPHPGIDPALTQAVRERDRQLGWQLLHNPARLRVETIDALNSRLARALPVAARAAPDLTIARSPHSLYQHAARLALESAWLTAEDRPAVELLFARLDNSWPRLQGLLADMLKHRSHWLPRVMKAAEIGLTQRVQQSLDSLLSAELGQVCSRLPAALRAEGEWLLAQSQRALGCPLPAGAALDGAAASLPHWRALAELALTDKGWRRRFTVRQGFGRGEGQLKERITAWVAALEAQPGALEWLRGVQALPGAQLELADQRSLEAMGTLLVRSAVQLQLVFADSGKVDYAYVAGAARESLTEQGEPSELALRTGAALQHILVDEFQDTSYEQLRLLHALTIGWEPGDGRTLFLVGDPMQSIYQFREAEVGLFLQARDHGIGAVRVGTVQLRRNFRTRAPLLGWINQHFESLFPPEDDPRLAAIRYLRSVAADDAPVDDPPVRCAGDAPVAAPVGSPMAAPVGIASTAHLHRFARGDHEAEAQRALEVIREARAQAPQCTVAVLVASREHATRIAGRLREAGLPIHGVDLEPLRDRPMIRDLAALTRALLHGADRSAWLALLRAPWCALTLGQLEALCAHDDGDLFGALQRQAQSSELDASARAALRRFCEALAPALLGEERNLPLWRRVERCWLRLAGPAIYPQPIDRLDGRRFLDALALEDDPEELAGESLDRLLAQLYSSEPAQPGAIDIMTMHAAKGLEWDVVILPGLGRPTAGDHDPLLHWIELPRPGRGTELLLSPIRAGEREPRGSLAAYIKGLRRTRTRIERARLAYVAVTRARQALHLMGALKADEDAGARPASGSLLHILWPAIGPAWSALPISRGHAAPAGQAAGEPAAKPARERAPLWRLPGDWVMPPPPPPPHAERLSLGSVATHAEPEYSWVGVAARAVGTIVHAELHRLALGGACAGTATDATDATEETPAALDAMMGDAQRYERWLGELGVERSQQPQAHERIVQALRSTLADPRGRWLLSSRHREAHSEWRLSGVHEGRLVNVIFDRMLVDHESQRWVVDFKTSSHEGGAVERFVDAEIERYRPQLHRYAALARALGPEPVRVALYFPLLGVFREVIVPA